MATLKPFSDSLHQAVRIQEGLEKASREFRATALGPLWSLNEQLARMVNVFQAPLTAFQKVQEQLAKYATARQGIFGEGKFALVQEAMRRVDRTYQAIRNQLTAAADVEKSLRHVKIGADFAQMITVQPAFARIQIQLAEMAERQRHLFADSSLARLRYLLPPTIADLARNAAFLREINFDLFLQTIREAKETGPQAEVTPADAATMQGILEEPQFQDVSLATTLNLLMDRVAELTEKIESQQAPEAKASWISTKKLLIALLFFLFTTLGSRYVNQAMDYMEGQRNPTAVVHRVAKWFSTSEADKWELRPYRVVKRPIVKVYRSYKSRFNLVATHSAGTLVRLLRKRKKWSLIEWWDEELGYPIQGWVRNKYLRRIVK